MEQRNLLLAFALSLAVLLLWSALMEPRRPGPAPGAREVERTQPERRPAQTQAAEPTPGAAREVAPSAVFPKAAEERFQLDSGLARVEVTSRGAGIVRWELTQYTTDAGDGPQVPVELSFREPEDPPALATPLPGLGLGDLSQAPFRTVERTGRSVTFELGAKGVTVRKALELEPDGYTGRLRLEVRNDSERSVTPELELVSHATVREGPDYSTTGLTALQEGELVRVDVRSFGSPGFFGSMFGRSPELERRVPQGVEWAGVDTNYFLAVLLPDSPRDARARFSVVELGKKARWEVGYPSVEIPPGHSVVREFELFVGPKKPKRLEAVHAHLERSIDLGWAWVAPLTRLFIWLLDICYALVPNYGVAIILLTVLVRVVTAPLMAKQMRSMKKLGEIQPQMRAIQEKYADDRQRQSQEVMKLMRESGANPLGGCLPMLFQFPFLIGLFWALRSSIELRQAPFVAWIQDLSSPETLFVLPGVELPVRVLPLAMGASMILQQRMSPTTMDPAQARMMMTIMPVMLTVISYQFPSGLVLYWFVSNVLAIAHQAWVNQGANGAAAR